MGAVSGRSPISSRSSVAVVANGTIASNAYGTMAAGLHPFSIRHGHPCCACSPTSSSRSTGRPNDAENVLLQGCSLNSAVRSLLVVQQSLHIQRSVFRADLRHGAVGPVPRVPEVTFQAFSFEAQY